MIKLLDKETGAEYTAVALGNGEESEKISIQNFSSTGVREFVIEEVVPMEYAMTGMEGEEGARDRLNGTENGSVVTVKPGDDILVTLTNVPSHTGYFHHTACVTNKTQLTDGANGSFTAEADYAEKHGNKRDGSTAPTAQNIFRTADTSSGKKKEDDE